MNLSLSPEEYQDVDSTIDVIIEALELLLFLDGGDDRRHKSGTIGFAPARLKQGYGPEVIWTLSVLADRALELAVEASPGIGRPQIIYHDKQAAGGTLSLPNCIVIGQPLVGGGLTTRPLGSYLVDDSSLNLRDEIVETSSLDVNSVEDTYDPKQWHIQVDQDTPALKKASSLHDDYSRSNEPEWGGYMIETEEANEAVAQFLGQTKSLLEMIANRIEKQMQTIHSREKFLQDSLAHQFDEFLETWRAYISRSRKNTSLMEQIGLKTDLFDTYVTRLKLVGSQIDARTRELNDGAKLNELQARVESLRTESESLELKSSLLLTLYAKQQEKFLPPNSS